jgi:hypothetical protein
MFTLLVLACTGATSGIDSGATDTGPEPELEYVFSFALLADPHIVSTQEHVDRLVQVQEWIDAQAEDRGLELVLVLGDIGWGEGLEPSYDLLNAFSVPWVPVAGDNMLHVGDEERWQRVFAPQMTVLAETFQDFHAAPQPTFNPDWDRDSWFANYAFVHRGVTFMVLDWCSRSDEPIYGDTADLHDFDGGTLPWFQDQVQALESGPQESVVMASHMAMHLGPGSFNIAMDDVLEGWAGAYADQLALSVGGHLHMDIDQTATVGGWEVHVLDATWDDALTLSIVDVWGNGRRFAYEIERQVLDFD